MKKLPVDAALTETICPQVKDLASSMGNHGVDVVATPALILFFEAVSNNLARPYYENGEISVGTHVCIDHHAPADGNKAVNVTARLVLQKGRRLEFSMQCSQGDVLIMDGTHHRAVMTRERFSKQDEQASPARKTIDFWFDFHSPWCYFASHKVGEIAQQSGAQINWLPVHLANLNQAVSGRRPLEENDRFVSWYRQDQYDTAAMAGLPFSPNENYPLRPSRALRVAIYAAEQGRAEPFVQSLMRGYWAEQKDISDLECIRQSADEAGLNGAAAIKAARADEYKTKLSDNLQLAIEQNLFGLPAAVVDGKIFWGNDRLELLGHYLSGRTPRL